MSRKHAELEREFLADLEPRTGRTLSAWMASIDAAGLAERNAIIDWLRPQGLTFAHASWLERIHHNGGRPIYGELRERPNPSAAMPHTLEPAAPPAPPITAPPTAPLTRPDTSPVVSASRPPLPLQQPPVVRTAPAPTPVPVQVPRHVPASAPGPAVVADAALAEMLARAKGLRPLAEMLMRELRQAVPEFTAAPAGEVLSLRGPLEFGVLSIGPRELKLGLDLGGKPIEPPFVRARIPGASERITHMLILNDARQIGQPLLDLAVAAAEFAGGPK